MVFKRCYPSKSYPESMPNSEYRNMRLGLESLEIRRKRNDLIMCFKTLNGIVSLDSKKFYTTYTSRTRGSFRKLRTKKVRTTIRQKSFSYRSAKMFSKLPSHVQQAPTLATFKSSLLKIDLSNF